MQMPMSRNTPPYAVLERLADELGKLAKETPSGRTETRRGSEMAISPERTITLGLVEIAELLSGRCVTMIVAGWSPLTVHIKLQDIVRCREAARRALNGAIRRD
jgi:hypothetical protein